MSHKSTPEISTANLGFEQRLWLAADKLRNNMDAMEPLQAEIDSRRQPAPPKKRGSVSAWT
jgi:hypothetical protein